MFLFRAAWFVSGLVAMALGLLGIVLPLLPTTPFLLLAAFCFARSSPALHDWIVQHPRLGPPIRDWRNHGAISGRAKAAAVAGWRWRSSEACSPTSGRGSSPCRALSFLPSGPSS